MSANIAKIANVRRIFLATSLIPSYPNRRGARLLNGVKRGALLAPKEVVIKKQYFIFLGLRV